MHILNVTTASLDDLVEPVDLRQAPAPVASLSFSDSDLAGMAAAWGPGLPELRLAALRDLRHPMSVDLWLERVAVHARVVLVRLLGGCDWWAYGCDRLAALARERGIALALLPGECRERDARLAALSTVPEAEQAALLACFREGGPENMAVLLGRLARLAGEAVVAREARAVPRVGVWRDGRMLGLADVRRSRRPLVPVLFYRSMLLAADHAPVEALAAALAAEGIEALPVFVPSLRDGAAAAEVESGLARLGPAAIVTATAFAAGEGGASLFDRLGVPVFQVVPATTRREAWAGGARGLAPADLAMHVVLPELDGRVLAGAVSFKDVSPRDERFGLGLQVNRPEPGRVAQVARRVAALVRLAATPPAERRLAVLIPDYPAAAGRAGYAVGLDVPASVLALLADLRDAGYAVEGVPGTARELMRMLEQGSDGLPLAEYRGALEAVTAAWGGPEADAPEGMFRFRAARFGNVMVALAPDRGRSADRRVEYHDPALPPRHALVAFGLWLREALGVQALVHVGAHGTLEWLPGKTVALSDGCFPEVVAGALPVVYPFIVSNPGEAAQAKRRIAAVTIGHLTPPLVGAGLSEAERASSGWSTSTSGRWARPAAARPAGAAGRRDGAGERARGRGRRRRGRRSGGGAGADRRLALRPQGLRDQGRVARLWPGGGRGCAGAGGLRRGGARGAARGARRAACGAGAVGGAGARADRRAPDRAQPLHRRPADAADPTAFALGRGGGRARCCGGTCRSTATGRGRSSSTSGAARACAPAARRSRRAWR